MAKNVQSLARFLTTFDFEREYLQNGALKFLHALETDQGLLAHTTNPIRGPPKNSNRKHLKFSLKFSVLTAITLGVVGVTSRNFTMGCSSWPG